MSGFDYEGLQADAAALIADFGGPITLYRKVAGTYSVATGQSVDTEQIIQHVGVITEFSKRQSDGARVQSGDKRVIFSAFGVPAPQVGDDMVIDGARHRLNMVDRVAPSGSTVVIYEAVARRA